MRNKGKEKYLVTIIIRLYWLVWPGQTWSLGFCCDRIYIVLFFFFIRHDSSFHYLHMKGNFCILYSVDTIFPKIPDISSFKHYDKRKSNSNVPLSCTPLLNTNTYTVKFWCLSKAIISTACRTSVTTAIVDKPVQQGLF